MPKNQARSDKTKNDIPYYLVNITSSLGFLLVVTMQFILPCIHMSIHSKREHTLNGIEKRDFNILNTISEMNHVFTQEMILMSQLK